MGNPAVLVFCRYPEPGATKTRLARDIGRSRASALYSAFVHDVLDALRAAAADITLVVTPEREACQYRCWLGNHSALVFQQGNDLGQRMANAFNWRFSRGADKALLLGTDIPQLRPAIVREAWRSLDRCDVVLGPADDGGYYLLGLHKKSFSFALFKNVSWGSRHVLAQTLARLPRGARPALLPRLTDCDTLQDLRHVLQSAGPDHARATRRQARVFGLP